MKNNVLPADTFVVVNKTVLQEDRKLLISLYQPLIGSTAISLYYTLWTYLDQFEMMSNEYTHTTLLNNMMITINEMNDARVKLEAIGLIKTYVREDSITNFVYELYSPLSAKEFLTNPVLNIALKNAVGITEFERIVEYFKLPNINLKKYNDITHKFSDIFLWNESHDRSIDVLNLRNKNKGKITIISKIDLATIFNLIPDDILNHKSITRDMRDYITKIAYIYNYDNEAMVELIRNSITDKHTVDKKRLRDNADKYYQFDHMGKLPSLIYRNQPEYLRSNKQGMTKKMQMIHIFETTSPYDFISSKYRTGNPTQNDLKIIAYLLLDLDLKPGVVNVLVDYVLKINNNKLIKSFVDTIAGQWKKNNIETVEDAMGIAETEYKKRNNRDKKQIGNKKQELKPNWFNQDIKSNEASDDEIRELEAMLAGK